MSAILDHYSQKGNRLLNSFFASLSVAAVIFFTIIGIIVGLTSENFIILLGFTIVGVVLYCRLQRAARYFSNEGRIRRLKEKLDRDLEQAKMLAQREREELYRQAIWPSIKELTLIINGELNSRRNDISPNVFALVKQMVAEYAQSLRVPELVSLHELISNTGIGLNEELRTVCNAHKGGGGAMSKGR